MMTGKIRLLCVLFLWTICSCAFIEAAPTPLPADPGLVTANPNASATPTAFQPALPNMTIIPPNATYPPTLAATDIPTDTEVPPTDTLAPPTDAISSPTVSAPTNARAQYTFYLTLDYAGHSAGVDETVAYTNNTGQALSNIVMAVEPNLFDNCFFLNSINQDGNNTNYTLDGHRLTINLAQPLPAGTATVFNLNYSLSIPAKRFEMPFGYLGYQINLTDWYPFIVPYSNGWILHDAWAFGEYLVYDSADYEVNVKVNAPSVIIAASGLSEANGDWTRYKLSGARTFALSASTIFKVAESTVGATTIRSYYFANDENAGQAVLWMENQSISIYSAKFAPYPYQSLSVVETEAPDGQEYDGLVFLSEKFYSEYNGTAKSNLIDIGTHEIAHQWWFGLVGDDQATEPWLDEAMATYSEKIFYEFNYPKYGNWWWNFRVNYFGPIGYVDNSIYNAGSDRAYINAVYLNGANFINEIRARVGDDDFFAFLQDYAARFSHGRATSADFFATLRNHTSADFSDIVARYFQGSY